MKLQRTTMGLLAIAALSLGGVYWVQSTTTQQTAEQEQQQRLFTFAETDVQHLNLKTPEHRLQLDRQPLSTRDQALPTIDQWTMTVSETVSPETPDPETVSLETPDPEATNPEATNPETPNPEATNPETPNPEATNPEANSPNIASDAAVAYLLNALSTLKGDRPLVVPRTQLAEYGLSDPKFVAILKTQSSEANGQPTTYRLELGKTGFNDDFIYIRIDPEPTHLPQPPSASIPPTPTPTANSAATEAMPAADTVTLFLVPKTLEYAIARPLGEWRSPDPSAPDTDAPDQNPTESIPSPTASPE